jgi:hypothetical protein
MGILPTLETQTTGCELLVDARNYVKASWIVDTLAPIHATLTAMTVSFAKWPAQEF